MRAILISRKPGGQWATRNDRYSFDARAKDTLEGQIALAEKEAQLWYAAEPLSEFRVIVANGPNYLPE